MKWGVKNAWNSAFNLSSGCQLKFVWLFLIWIVCVADGSGLHLLYMGRLLSGCYLTVFCCLVPHFMASLANLYAKWRVFVWTFFIFVSFFVPFRMENENVSHLCFCFDSLFASVRLSDLIFWEKRLLKLETGFFKLILLILIIFQIRNISLSFYVWLLPWCDRRYPKPPFWHTFIRLIN